MRSKVILAVCVVMSVAPPLARADWVDFAPRPFENGAFLDVFSSYERDRFESGTARTRQWEDTFIREKFTLFSNGYSYDPRFLVYHFSVAGVLRQEHYDSSFPGPGGWSDATGLEYDGRFTLLPEHPYNVSVFASRYEPLFKEQGAAQHNAVGSTYGVSGRYRQKPYFLHLGYVDNNVDSGQVSSDVRRVDLDGQYFKRFADGNEVSFTGRFAPSWFGNSQGLDGTSMEYSAGNMTQLWHRVRLTSNVSRNEFDQASRTAGGFTTDQLAWYELLNLYLPWNLRADLSYRYRDNQSRFEPPAPAATRTLSDRSDDLQFDLAYRLYQSLDARYTFLRDARRSIRGQTTGLSNAATVNYGKFIPRGRVLAGVSAGRGETETMGIGAGISDAFSAVAVPGGTFLLRQQNVDPSSLVVFFKSPLPPFQFIQLELGEFLVEPALNTLQIRVLTLPPEFTVPGTYDFVAFYSLTTGNFSLRTDTAGATASAQLFDNLVTPYLSYVRATSDVLEGVFPGTPIDSKTSTAGTILYRAPFRLLGEYQDFDANLAPYRAWRAEAQCVAALNPRTSVYAILSYIHRRYPRGTAGPGNAPYYAAYGFAYSEVTQSAAANIERRLPAWNMFLAAGGTYSRLSGLVDTNAYALQGSWTWHVGKMDVSVGATAYVSDASGAQTVSTRRDRQLVYLNLRRRLF